MNHREDAEEIELEERESAEGVASEERGDSEEVAYASRWRGEEIEAELRALAERRDLQAAVAFIRDDDEATLATQIELTEIPAPPYGEAARAERVADLLRSAGLESVRVDEIGNVVAERPGSSDGPALVVSAHLDTVFPAGTDVSVERDGALLRGPGISDDGRGLAALVALARALRESELATRLPLRFVATVGEEGAGDLRGVKAFFSDPETVASTGGFISLDGAGIERIVAEGLQSRRFRITVRGPGGHSWTDWGTPNPAHALMDLGSHLQGLSLPDEPKTTLTIARVGGGKSINAIPQAAWMELDTRSLDGATLEGLVARLRSVVESERAGHDGLTYEVEVIGDRPGGSTAADARLLLAARAATRFIGHDPELAISSTDANVAMGLGIPAVTLGCGGEAGKAHTTDEWYRNVDGPDGIVRALYVVALTAGLADDPRADASRDE